MHKQIDYKQTNNFSNLFIDYLEKSSKLHNFYNRFPNLKNFELQIKEKANNYKNNNRQILVNYLQKQYATYQVTKSTKSNIEALLQQNTFTITTGHQLNLFTGPLYTFYKIISIIKTCQKLKIEYPKNDFVPIFWLASEDHDFQEINHFYFSKQKIAWQTDQKGAVGELRTTGLQKTYTDFKNLLQEYPLSNYLSSLFESAYIKHHTLSEATIYIYNQLFGEYGLVILEPNHRTLKNCFKEHLKKELVEQQIFKDVTETSTRLKSLSYHQQVYPREINLFYKNDNLRERIVYKDNQYVVRNTDLYFSKTKIIKELDKNPDKFSPNALMRPLYQETLLPNLSYVGGAAEIAYWLQLKTAFQSHNVSFPMLQMRSSALLYTTKTIRKLKKLEIDIQDLFLSNTELIKMFTKKNSNILIDFSKQKEYLSKQFIELYTIAKQTDKSFINAVAAQEKKQHNGIDKLEKRLLKAQKIKFKDQITRLIKIQDELFPQQKLQERIENFSEIQLRYQKNLISLLFQHLNPLDYRFSLIELE